MALPAVAVLLLQLCCWLRWAPLVHASTYLSCPKIFSAGKTSSCYASAPAETLVLESAGGDQVAQALGVQLAVSPRLFSFNIGAELPVGEYSVISRDGEAANLNTVSVSVSAEQGVVILGTDKGLYKPGQEVKVRALHLAGTSKLPLAANVTISMKNPEDFKVFEEVATADGYGVATLSIPLAFKVAIGKYSLEAAVEAPEGLPAATAAASFEVDEYVLPKFEVVLNLTKTHVLLPDSGGLSVSGSACGLYTYGEMVPGKLTLRLIEGQSYDHHWGLWGGAWGGDAIPELGGSSKPSGSSGEDENPALLQLQADLTDSPTKEFRLDLTPQQVDQIRYFSSLVIEAEIEDEATGTIESAEAVVHLHQQPDTATITMDESFAPGLPQRVHVAVGSHGDLELSDGGYILKVSRSFGHNGWDNTEIEEINLTTPLSQTLLIQVPADGEGCDAGIASDDYRALQDAHRLCLNSLRVEVRNGDRGVQTEGTTHAYRVFAVDGHYLQVHQDGAASASGDGKLTASVSAYSTLNLTSAACQVAVSGGGAPLWSGMCGQVAPDSQTGAYFAATMQVELDAALVRGLSTVQAVVMVYVGSGYATDKVEIPVPADFYSGYATSLQWVASEVKPGDTVDLTVSSAGAARVFLLGVDKAVDLLAGDSPPPAIDAATLTSALEERQVASQPVAFSPKVCPSDAPVVVAITQQDGMVWDLREDTIGTPCPTPLIGGSGGGGDDFMVFGDAVPEMAAAMPMADGAVADNAEGSGGSGPDVAEVAAVRKHFPETWLFEEVTMGGPQDGSTQDTQTQSYVVPDSITEWRVAAFSTHPTLGFSEAGVMKNPLVVKKDLFVQMSLPAFVVHMETPTVVLTVQNLLADDLAQVLLTIRLPSGFQAQRWPGHMSLTDTESDGTQVATGRVDISGESFWRGELVLKPTEVQLTVGLAIYFSVQSSAAVGKSDAVEKRLIVKPAGVPIQRPDTVLLQDPGAQQTQEFGIPSGIAQASPGSAFARLTVVGDIMGNAMANLDSLVTVPTGCGEQTMIGLAPNVYVLTYLNSAGRLGAEMKNRLVKNINLGVQRELMYRHPSSDLNNGGGFSAFGDSDDEASTWLTAYVLKVFSEASRFVVIDPAILADAGAFLTRHQDSSSGAFAKVGKVIHEDMMGGATDSVALTAYVSAALSAADEATGQSAFASAISTAQSHLQDMRSDSVYTQLLIATAVAAASGDWDSAATSALALRAGSDWKVEVAPTPAPNYDVWFPSYHVTPSLDVEATAYAIQILLRGGEEGAAVLAAQWLVTQQTPRGGWASTQDTVVGLEALSKVAQTLSSSTNIACDASYNGVAKGSFQVNDNNFDLLQMIDLDSPEAGAALRVSCSGTGTAVVSLVSQWYAEQVPDDDIYNLTVQWRPTVVDERRRLTVDSDGASQLMDVTACASLLDGVESGTSQSDYHVFELGMYSGFSCDPDRVEAPGHDDVINRVETEEGKLVVYLDTFPATGVCLTCQATRQHIVSDLQAVHTSVYSYYNQQVRGERQVGLSVATRSEAGSTVATTAEAAGTTPVTGPATTSPPSTTPASGTTVATTTEAATATPPQYLTVQMTVEGVDYDRLSADASLLETFKAKMRETVASEAAVSLGDVMLRLSRGSVVVLATIRAPSGGAATLQDTIESSTTLRGAIASAVNAVSGIEAATDGSDISVASVSVSVGGATSTTAAADGAGQEPNERQPPADAADEEASTLVAALVTIAIAVLVAMAVAAVGFFVMKRRSAQRGKGNESKDVESIPALGAQSPSLASGGSA